MSMYTVSHSGIISDEENIRNIFTDVESIF
jgi:hypothetical protein